MWRDAPFAGNKHITIEVEGNLMTKAVLEKPREIGKRMMIAVADLKPNPANRNVTRDEEIKTLSESIKEVGLLHPIIVRHHPEEEGMYLIIAGERRWRAAKRAGFETVPCVLASGGDDDSSEAQILGVVENHQRKNLSAIEEAASVRQLLEAGLETEAIARSLGRSRAWVSRRSSLVELSESWMHAIQDEESRIASWPASHLELIARFPHPVQDRLLHEWKSQWQWRVPSLSELVQITGECQRMIASAPWKPEDDTLYPKAGACASCLKRSSHHPDLFESEDEVGATRVSGDRCLDPECWSEKSAAYLKRRMEEVKTEHEDFALLVNSERAGEVMIESAGKPIVFRSAVTLCKKTDKRAAPALVVAGPGLGRIKWIQMPKESKGRLNGHAPSNGSHNANGTGEKSLDEKRAPYERRRRQHVIDAVRFKIEALANSDHVETAAGLEGGDALVSRGLAAKTIVLLHTLLSEHGWMKDVHQISLELPENLNWEVLSKLQNHSLGSDTTREELLALIWSLLRLCLTTIARRLTLSSSERENEDHYRDAETVCQLLAFNLAHLRAEASKAVPYAKSWSMGSEDTWLPRAAGSKPETH